MHRDMKRLGVFVAALAAIVLCAVPSAARADSNTGGIRGYVREHAGSAPNAVGMPVAGASVQLWDGYEETAAHTDARGFYVLFGLHPGFYEVRADNGAFTTDPFLSERYVCVHAGIVEDVNLQVVPRLVADYDYDAAIKRRYYERFRPDPSQTADLYSIGGC
jgi:hypothetical protein